jgi:hypothetical protein
MESWSWQMANGGKCVSVCGRVQCLHALVGCRPPVVVSMTNFPSTCCDDVGSIGLLHTQCVQWMQNLLGIKRRRFFTACVLNLLEPMQTRTNQVQDICSGSWKNWATLLRTIVRSIVPSARVNTHPLYIGLTHILYTTIDTLPFLSD